MRPRWDVLRDLVIEGFLLVREGDPLGDRIAHRRVLDDFSLAGAGDGTAEEAELGSATPQVDNRLLIVRVKIAQEELEVVPDGVFGKPALACGVKVQDTIQGAAASGNVGRGLGEGAGGLDDGLVGGDLIAED